MPSWVPIPLGLPAALGSDRHQLGWFWWHMAAKWGTDHERLESNIRLYTDSLEWSTDPTRWHPGPLPDHIEEGAAIADLVVEFLTSRLARIGAGAPTPDECRAWFLNERGAGALGA